MESSVVLFYNTDYCRIGSLENEEIQGLPLRPDYCRIGSLETVGVGADNPITDHCRIGSLENVRFPFLHVRFNHRRDNRKTIKPA